LSLELTDRDLPKAGAAPLAARAQTRGAGRVPNALGRTGEDGNTIVFFAGGVRHSARIGEMNAPLDPGQPNRGPSARG
jgi:hypothetical protein